MIAAVAVPRGFTVTSAGGGTRYGRVVVFTAPQLDPSKTLTWSITVSADTTASATCMLLATALSATRDPRLIDNVAARIVRVR